MTKFESEVKTINATISSVYNKLSDLSNIESLKDRIPSGKIDDLQCSESTLSFSVSPIGEIELAIVEKEVNKTIKFASKKSPISFNLWIQLIPSDNEQTRMKLTIGAELNVFTKGIASKPLKEGVEKLADMLALIPYN